MLSNIDNIANWQIIRDNMWNRFEIKGPALFRVSKLLVKTSLMRDDLMADMNAALFLTTSTATTTENTVAAPIAISFLCSLAFSKKPKNIRRK